MYVEYSSNNSGGHWWLEDADWKNLEAAGWKVEWAHLENLYDAKGKYVRDEDGTPKLVPVGEGNNRFKSLGKSEENGTMRSWVRWRKQRIGLACACAMQPKSGSEQRERAQRTPVARAADNRTTSRSTTTPASTLPAGQKLPTRRTGEV